MLAQVQFSFLVPFPMPASARTLPRQRKKARKPPAQSLREKWEGLKPADLEGLDQKIKTAFKWEHSPRPYQLQAIEAQLLRQDVLIHAGTGSGKTAVAAGPHAHEKAAGMVTFMVSPLIALQEEQVRQNKSIKCSPHP